MRSFLAIFRLTVAERWPVVPAALALGLVPPVLAWIWPEVERHGPPFLPMAIALSLLVAFLLGMSLFGGDLASGRATFLFARPVRGATIWAARLAAGLGLALLVQLLLAGFICALWPSIATTGIPLDRGAIFTTAEFTAIVAAAGAVSGILARARGRWLAVNCAGVVLMVATQIYISRFHDADDVLGAVVPTASLLCLLAASAAAVIIGRTSARRAQAAGSLVLWAGALPISAALLVYAHGFLSLR